jgi:mRNA interferase RelE/StbE
VGSYRLVIKPSAAKEIESLPNKKVRQQVVARIRALADDPRPPGCEKLSGSRDLYRVRQGNFRIVYSVSDEQLVVLVVRVRDRKNVYR